MRRSRPREAMDGPDIPPMSCKRGLNGRNSQTALQHNCYRIAAPRGFDPDQGTPSLIW